MNGTAVGSVTARPAWAEARIPLGSVPRGAPYVLEMRREGEVASFDDACFEVDEVIAAPPMARLLRWITGDGRVRQGAAAGRLG